MSASITEPERAAYIGEQRSREAKRALVHYFKVCDPTLSGDCFGEIEGIVDDIAEAGAQRALRDIAEREEQRAPKPLDTSLPLGELVTLVEVRSAARTAEIERLTRENAADAEFLGRIRATIEEHVGAQVRTIAGAGPETAHLSQKTKADPPRGPMPADWMPENAKAIAAASGGKFTEAEVLALAPRFRQRMINDGKQGARWGATFRSWVLHGSILEAPPTLPRPTPDDGSGKWEPGDGSTQIAQVGRDRLDEGT